MYSQEYYGIFITRRQRILIIYIDGFGRILCDSRAFPSRLFADM